MSRAREQERHEDADASLARALKAACESMDAASLASLLDPEVNVIVDGGGKGAVTADPTWGVTDGLGLLLRVLATQPGSAIVECPVNGTPGLVVRRDATVVAVICFRRHRGRARDVWVVMNPDKLASWNVSQTTRLRGHS